MSEIDSSLPVAGLGCRLAIWGSVLALFLPCRSLNSGNDLTEAPANSSDSPCGGVTRTYFGQKVCQALPENQDPRQRVGPSPTRSIQRCRAIPTAREEEK